jgi:regulator of replication initiation timing
VALKKACNWRTALVVEELNHEVQAQKDTQEITNQINQLMDEKVVLERDLDDLYTREFEQGDKVPKETLKEKFDQIEKIDKELGTLIKQYEQKFNVHWGEVMRAGAEPSRFAGQIEKYACIYMSKISDFVDFGPRTYFRPKRKVLAHEMD